MWNLKMGSLSQFWEIGQLFSIEWSSMDEFVKLKVCPFFSNAALSSGRSSGEKDIYAKLYRQKVGSKRGLLVDVRSKLYNRESKKNTHLIHQGKTNLVLVYWELWYRECWRGVLIETPIHELSILRHFLWGCWKEAKRWKKRGKPLVSSIRHNRSIKGLGVSSTSQLCGAKANEGTRFKLRAL